MNTLLRAFVGLLVAVSLPAAHAGTLLVLNKSDHTVSLLDSASGKATAKVPTGVGPHEVALSPDGRVAVVTNYGSQAQPGNTLTVIDVAAAKVLRTIDLGEHRRPHGIAWLENDVVAVTTEGSGSLLLVATQTGKLTATIPTGQQVSHMVALAPKLKRAFVANIGSGTVTVIDLEKKRHVADVRTGAGAEGIDVSPDQREVWVTNREADTVSVLNADTLAIEATLESKAFPIRVKLTADGRHALVSNARSGDVAVFETATRREITRIPMQAESHGADSVSGRMFTNQFGSSPVPVGILIVPELGHAYVANTNADIVSVIDLERWKITGRLSAGKEPDGLGFTKSASGGEPR